MTAGGEALHVRINVSIWLLLLFTCCPSHALQSDIHCLKAVHGSLKDPHNYLSNWNFNNHTEGFLCKFIGVDCWYPDENRVLNFHVANFGLEGEFPVGLENCASLTGVDLSGNKLYGSLPSNISSMLAYVTSLDLSSNAFSGTIPKSLANCDYLNDVQLNDNQLTGHIPPELGLLSRIKTFNVANNSLSGPVPSFNSNAIISADSCANNSDLCGGPLPPCKGREKYSDDGFIIGATNGEATIGIGASAFIVVVFFAFHRVSRKRDDDPDGNQWAKSIKGAKGIKVSMIEKSVSELRLSDLMKATNSFSNDHIIGSGKTGTMYRAQLDDGTSLMVKHLQDSQYSAKEFTSKIATLGNVKHGNLVPLLGFCVAKKERFLVYQYMENGSLHDRLHLAKEGTKPMDWPSRLKIGMKAAKGFAWLHHSCNPPIVHGNVSSKRILLDSDFEPKISDFVDTHLGTLVATRKGDVYSFGVVLLELVTGEMPTSISKAPEFEGSLVEWITHLSCNSNLDTAIDINLVREGNCSEIYHFLKVAYNCVISTPEVRPTMFEVYQLLRAIGERYDFVAEDEILMPSESLTGDFIEEIIVAR